MQRLAWEIKQLVAQRFRQAAGGSGDPPEIHWITDDRISLLREMDADLMGAPGREPAFQQCYGCVPGLPGLIGGAGSFAARYHGHALAVARVAPDGALDIAGRGAGQTPGESQIIAIDIARRKRRRQCR